jgi:Tfp pilus assembly protein PilP
VRNAAGELFASVETPDGIGFKVVRGTTVGREGSTVVEISQSGIVIEEEKSEQRALRAIPLRPKN